MPPYFSGRRRGHEKRRHEEESALRGKAKLVERDEVVSFVNTSLEIVHIFERPSAMAASTERMYCWCSCAASAPER
jgi:hypothetical protein